MSSETDFLKLAEFEWDEGNIDKNWRKHEVTNKESEQVFFNQPLLINIDKKHSTLEQRFHALGQTEKGRKLFVAFTLRKEKIRVISARDQNKIERREYEKQIKTTTNV
jgi:uncharacterized DUF497 family protein